MWFRSSSSFALIFSFVVSGLAVACGEKGDDEPAMMMGSTGGTTSTAPMTLYGFDTGSEGFMYEPYTPDDPLYTNKGADAAATLAWDEGSGSDGEPGRLRLEVPFDGYNQLADIQLNQGAMDWSGKTLRARVMIESGFSPEAMAPGGAYIFAKTTDAYIWGRGGTVNLAPNSVGMWTELAFALNAPGQMNADFDAAAVVSLGIQFYTGAGTGVTALPTATVAYVDLFTLQ